MRGNWNTLLIILALIILNAFFAAAEIALVSMRKTRLAHLAREGNRRAQAALALVKDPNRLLATIQIGVTLAGFLASAAAAVSLAGSLGEWLAHFFGPLGRSLALVISTVAVSYVTLVLGELAPKRIALHSAERVALALAGPIQFFSRAARPFVYLLAASTSAVAHLLGAREGETGNLITDEEIRTMVQEHHGLAQDEKAMIHGVFEFGDRLVREIMTHRADMVALDEETPLGDFPAVVAGHGFSRYPVFRDSIDNITGYVAAKDFLVSESTCTENSATVATLKREALFVPETKKALDLLRLFKESHNHPAMAVVVDEYGETSGLVTLEDLLEEIVGELEDEFAGEVRMQRLNSGEVIIAGRVSTAEVNEMMPVRVPDGPYETLAGFCLFRLGHIPREGETFRWGDFVFRADVMEQRRITRVRIKPVGNNHRDKNAKEPSPQRH